MSRDFIDFGEWWSDDPRWEPDDAAAMEADAERVRGYVTDGHTDHCACRIVWGDGECSCGRGIMGANREEP